MKNFISVFIVEDSDFLREMLARVFTSEGIKIVGMADGGGEKTLSRIKSLKPDVVLVDLVLPQQNGLWLINKINQIGDETKVLVCSSLKPEWIRTQVELSGALDFISKPFKSSEIVRAVFSAVQPEEHIAMAA